MMMRWLLLLFAVFTVQRYCSGQDGRDWVIDDPLIDPDEGKPPGVEDAGDDQSDNIDTGIPPTLKWFISTPQTYRAGEKATVVLSIPNLPIDIRLAISLANKGTTVTTMSRISRSTTAMQAVTFDVPAYMAGATVVTVAGSNPKHNVRVQRDISVNVERPRNQVFVQTDKPVYKPGGKVLLRVVLIDKDLKPVGNPLLPLVYVSNPSGSRVMQWTNLTLNHGMVSLEMPLSKKPVLGKWKIVAKYFGINTKQDFSVEKYVLPKFEVKITPPNYIMETDKQVTSTICAKYTYGKDVKGDLETKLCFHAYNRKITCETLTQKISGCEDVTFSLHKTTGWRSIKISATVTETSTGVKLNATGSLPRPVNSKYKLKFQVPKYYKPGFAYQVTLLVTTPDGRPATQTVPVSLTVSNDKLFRKTNQLQVANGMHVFTVNPLPSSYYSYRATYEKTAQSGNAYGSGRSEAWYSPSNAFLEVRPPKTVFAVNSQAKVTVRANTIPPHSSADYILVCRGRIVKSGQVSFTKSSSGYDATLMFAVTNDMVPKCRLMVYYISTDTSAELIADNIELTFKESWKNDVSVSFSETSRKPGAAVKLTLKAFPGSRVALSAVDRSVQLLGDTNDLTSEQIVDFLNSQDTGASDVKRMQKCQRPCRWCRRIDGGSQKRVDGLHAIKMTGLRFSSNAKIETVPCPKYPIYYTMRRMMIIPDRAVAFARPSPMFRVGVPERGVPGPTGPKGFSGKNVPMKKQTKKKKKQEAAPEKVRTDFPETWLWKDVIVKGGLNNAHTLEVIVPDTITTWYANAFAMSPVAGIGVARPASLTAFQPFFVSLTLPYSVVRGETAKVPATVFNYLDDCLAIELSIDQSPSYTITSATSTRLCVCGKQSRSFKFAVKPSQLGQTGVTVRATTTSTQTCPAGTLMASTVATDALTKKMLVEAEGVKKEITTSSYFCPTDHVNSVYTGSLRAQLPEKIVPGSVFAELSAVGDIMGPSMQGLEHLLKMPTGCGEQNMLLFAPNIYVLDYLTATNQLTSSIEEKAKGFMRSGYQRELTYRHADGSYSAFGERDKEGSTWLSAFVLRSYAQARKYVYIDPEEIALTQRWLLGLQDSSTGCFAEKGMVHHKDMKGGVTSGITMTSFVMTALLEAGTKNKGAILGALGCIIKGLKDVKDSYTAAVLAYSLTLAKSPDATQMLNKLEQLKVKNGSLSYWRAEKRPTPKKSHFFYFKPRPADIEMTSYALMAYTRADFGNRLDRLAIVRWLTKQRNSYGGFASTQDTCVGLQALSEYSKVSYQSKFDLNVKATTSDGTLNHKFSVNNHNRYLLQRVQLTSVPDEIGIEAKGTGCALAQLNIKYNIPDETEQPSFGLTVMVKDNKTPTCTHTLKVCGSYGGTGKSNMALIRVHMVSGFEPSTTELEMLRQTSGGVFSDYEYDDGVLTFYFDDFDQQSKCVTFNIDQVAEVEDRQPAFVKILDYYDPEDQETKPYKVEKCPDINTVS